MHVMYVALTTAILVDSFDLPTCPSVYQHTPTPPARYTEVLSVSSLIINIITIIAKIGSKLESLSHSHIHSFPAVSHDAETIRKALII